MKYEVSIISKIEAVINERVVSEQSVSGGCIANSKRITTESGRMFFLKTNAGTPGMFLNEANGLKELSKLGCIRVPSVVSLGEEYLLLEYIETGIKGGSFFSEFGNAVAHLHKYTSDGFGFVEDNYIGGSVQYNCAHGKALVNWDEFYYEYRILAQLKIAERSGNSTKELSKLVSKLESVIGSIVLGSEEPPALLHGDLWGGNYMCDSRGNAVIVDPAVYYGHREADLAMTKMFGGFTFQFYESYQSEYPLKEGWEYRENLYLLYHYMNHYNLFGSGYYQSCIDILKSYL